MTDYKTQNLPDGENTTPPITAIIMITVDPTGTPVDQFATIENILEQIKELDEITLQPNGATYGIRFINGDYDSSYGYSGIRLKPDGIGAGLLHQATKLIIESYDDSATYRTAGIALRGDGFTGFEQWGGLVAGPDGVYIDFGNKTGLTGDCIFRFGGSFTELMRLLHGGGLDLGASSSEPSDPGVGHFVIWQDETGGANDGDIKIKINSGGSVKTATLVDFSSL